MLASLWFAILVAPVTLASCMQFITYVYIKTFGESAKTKKNFMRFLRTLIFYPSPLCILDAKVISFLNII